MGNEESQTVIRDLHWSWSVHFYTPKDLLIKKKKRSEKYCASKNSDTAFKGTLEVLIFFPSSFAW